VGRSRGEHHYERDEEGSETWHQRL
jgi:hypothetical protein